MRTIANELVGENEEPAKNDAFVQHWNMNERRMERVHAVFGFASGKRGKSMKSSLYGS